MSINDFIPFAIEHPNATISLIIGLALLLFVFYKFNIIYLSYPFWKDLLTTRTARIACARSMPSSYAGSSR